MNISDLTLYQVFIDQLLTYETVDQLKNEFDKDDSLLTPDLLHALINRNSQASTEHKQLQWLIEEIKYLYGRKCLDAFGDLPDDEAIKYAQSNIADLATQANFNFFESIIPSQSATATSNSFLK